MTDERKEWLESAIYEYIQNNPGVDSVDVVSHFKLMMVNMTLSSLSQLVGDGWINRRQPMLVSQYYVNMERV